MGTWRGVVHNQDVTLKDLFDRVVQLNENVVAIAEVQKELQELLRNPPQERKSYSPAEAAEELSRKPYTVREWCRLGRINAKKRPTGRGDAEEWEISAEEVERIRNHGLLPIPAKY